MLTYCSRVDVDLWEVRDEAIKLSVHHWGTNLKATSIIKTNGLLKQVTQFKLSTNGEVFEGCELDFLGRADEEPYNIHEHHICWQGHFLVQVQYELWYLHIVFHHSIRIFPGDFPF